MSTCSGGDFDKRRPGRGHVYANLLGGRGPSRGQTACAPRRVVGSGAKPGLSAARGARLARVFHAVTSSDQGWRSCSGSSRRRQTGRGYPHGVHNSSLLLFIQVLLNQSIRF